MVLETKNIKIINLLKDYVILYKRYIDESITDTLLNIHKEKMKEIPKEIIEHLEFFIVLDKEYKDNAKSRETFDFKIFSIDRITNKNWRGLWLKATGMDADLYVNWLYAGLKYEQYKENTLEYWYRQQHPSDKYVPYSIKIVSNIFKKYYN